MPSSSDVQRFLLHPKPKSWINALDDHPALQDKVNKSKDKENIPDAVIKERIPVLEASPVPDPAITETNEEEITIEDHDDIREHTETVYDKSELVTAIDNWMAKIINPDTIPWSGDEQGGNSLLRNDADKIDPFHNFDWSSVRSHKGRLMKLVSGACNRQGRLHGKVDIVFSSGEELSGTFYQGKRNGKCSIKCPEKRIR